jgi:hypothetical protein
MQSYRLMVVAFVAIQLTPLFFHLHCYANDSNNIAFEAMVKSGLWMERLKEYDVEYTSRTHVGSAEDTVDQEECVICREMQISKDGAFRLAVSTGFTAVNRTNGTVNDLATTAVVVGDNSKANGLFITPAGLTTNYDCPSEGRSCLTIARPMKLDILPVAYFVPVAPGPEKELGNIIELYASRKDLHTAEESVKLWGRNREVFAVRMVNAAKDSPKRYGTEVLVSRSNEEMDQGLVLGLRFVELDPKVSSFTKSEDVKQIIRSVSARWVSGDQDTSLVYPAEIKQVCYVGPAEWTKTTTLRFESFSRVDVEKFGDEWFRKEALNLQRRVDRALSR